LQFKEIHKSIKGFGTSLMLSLIDAMVSLVVKVLWKFIRLICFRVYLEVNVHKNSTCFSRWSVSVNNKINATLRTRDDVDWYKINLTDKKEINFVFEHNNVKNSWIYWKAYLYNADMKEIKFYAFNRKYNLFL